VNSSSGMVMLVDDKMVAMLVLIGLIQIYESFDRQSRTIVPCVS
jgi:hypothetical protein